MKSRDVFIYSGKIQMALLYNLVDWKVCIQVAHCFLKSGYSFVFQNQQAIQR